ncbi:MAG: bi-domain-containing oxidoreductase [Prevotellaceae bacterium]|jgi:predicted dehydrogenase|nr:bi-domain-containing oxidoreductase [Prevotellaceae bacterium]
MNQLTQKLGSGAMVIQELPMPQLTSGMVLVRNHYSLISAGTEGSTVKAARKSLIGKAKERPQQVKQVLETLRNQGIVQTYRAVMKKLDAYSPLGYSCAGEVIEVADDVIEFKAGDKVACAGQGFASHAEVVSVPVNLCVKLDADADLAQACYNTLGAIALQSIRQADLRVGETCAVIGLGLLGQLACLQLRASGVRVVGIDVNENAVAVASAHCSDLALPRNTPGINDQINDFTGGLGVDAVIIAAATDSLDPVNFAGAIARKKGTVVILGAVPTGFDREPYYYKKELSLKMSCSYGPGRYDLNYEEKGIDYPAPYVRWTEKRNMEAFQKLISNGAIDLSYLTTHTFDFDDAPKAYDIVLTHSEPFLGIVLKYNTSKAHQRKKIIISANEKAGKINLAFIGAGSYAQGSLLPNLPKSGDIIRKGVLTNSGTTSKRVAERYQFEFCTSNEDDIIKNPDINTLFIATRHDSHAAYVIKGLENSKNIYVEKPLCLNIDELEQIKSLCEEKNKSVMIGFNRRFSPHAMLIKKKTGTGKMSMIYRINAGSIPSDSWIQDMKTGGGRIIGEVCHFIDMMTYMCGSKPVKVMASALNDSQGLNDTVNIILEFKNGSTGVIAYYANGSKGLKKEYFEVYASGTTAVINDFKEGYIYSNKKKQSLKLSSQDKGQKTMLAEFMKGLRNGELPIPMEQIFAVTTATFAVIKSIQEGGAPVKF